MLTQNFSSQLFTDPLLFAHAQCVTRGAKEVSVDPTNPPNDVFHVPCRAALLDSNPALLLMRLSVTIHNASNQKLLTNWSQENDPSLQHVKQICQAYPTIRARLNHLSQAEVSGPHNRFDLPSDQCIRYRPTAFLGNLKALPLTDFSPL